MLEGLAEPEGEPPVVDVLPQAARSTRGREISDRNLIEGQRLRPLQACRQGGCSQRPVRSLRLGP